MTTTAHFDSSAEFKVNQVHEVNEYDFIAVLIRRISRGGGRWLYGETLILWQCLWHGITVLSNTLGNVNVSLCGGRVWCGICKRLALVTRLADTRVDGNST